MSELPEGLIHACCPEALLDQMERPVEGDEPETALLHGSLNALSTGSTFKLRTIRVASGSRANSRRSAPAWPPRAAGGGGVGKAGWWRPPDWVSADVTRFGAQGSDLGGRFSLVEPDPDELLAVAQVEVGRLRGIVR